MDYPSAIDMTDRFVRSVTADKRTDFSDARQVGLRLRVTPTGSKTFCVKGRCLDGKVRTVTLGDYPTLSLKEARDRAAQTRRRMKEGGDPTTEKRALRQAAEQSSISLGELIEEYADYAASRRKIWQNSPRGRSEARRRLDSVFGSLMACHAEGISLEEYARTMRDHRPRKSHKTPSANGQVSRARAYLAPVLDWAAGRNRFRKVGAGRSVALLVPDLADTHDPAIDDPTISGRRLRVLDQEELARVLPLLSYPAPRCLQMAMPIEADLRPIALRFLLLTAARLDEVVQMRWRDVNFNTGVWHKPSVKSTRGGLRGQHLRLSDAAIELLRGLPQRAPRSPNEIVFPNSVGKPLHNWDRITRAVQRESKSQNWHRHDLRRTASTLMNALGIPGSVIDSILAHRSPVHGQSVSVALSHYVIATRILVDLPDPEKRALDRLADTLTMIEEENCAV